ncbi:hypothetical protein [Alkaliphilus hydrothermalis]|uniref:Uncharacterized protein n=1 Tax=Alkaliphilus hydrothermalis TaxID=1482730 RepID=A0ABS2NS73_9FIRM|nr:hypothetical protein [Alkaliphilus hydrothermalis]MBM7615781.1 hypothetical protein [Alkaliphilus hydrothermalis]
MRKISSVSKDRIDRMYIDRKINVNRISTVTPVDPVKPVHNEASFISDNYLLLTGSFYDKFQDLRQQYKDFYLNQQDLEDMMHQFKTKKGDDSLEEIITIIQQLVDKYNKTIISLRNFEEKLPRAGFTHGIHHTLLEYDEELATVGLTITEEVILNFDPSILRKNVDFQPNCLYFLFDYQQGLIRKLFTIFRNIKVSQLEESHGYKNNSITPPSGMLINERR